jgi:hypothetical protein
MRGHGREGDFALVIPAQDAMPHPWGPAADERELVSAQLAKLNGAGIHMATAGTGTLRGRWAVKPARDGYLATQGANTATLMG